MLAERCYPISMSDEPKISEMTEFGKAVWLVVQEQGAYSRAALAKVLGARTGWEPSRQAISQYLKGERGAPRELVPALVKAFELPEDTAERLQFLYFYGQGDAPYDRWRKARDSSGLITEENQHKLADKKREHEERHRKASEESGSVDDAGDRTL